MTSLEFIENKIKCKEKQSIYWSTRIEKEKDSSLKEFVTSRVKIYQEELQTLRQIKAELEAWEIVKLRIHHVKEQECFVIQTIISNNQYETIKKALEVNND